MCEAVKISNLLLFFFEPPYIEPHLRKKKSVSIPKINGVVSVPNSSLYNEKHKINKYKMKTK